MLRPDQNDKIKENYNKIYIAQMAKNTPYNTFMFMRNSFLNLEEEMNNRRKSHENCNLKSAAFILYIGWMAFMNSRGNKKPK